MHSALAAQVRDTSAVRVKLYFVIQLNTCHGNNAVHMLLLDNPRLL